MICPVLRARPRESQAVGDTVHMMGHDELSIVKKHKVKVFYFPQNMGPSAKMAILH